MILLRLLAGYTSVLQIAGCVVFSLLSVYFAYVNHNKNIEIAQLEEDLVACSSNMANIISAIESEDIQDGITRDYIEKLQNSIFVVTKHGATSDWLKRLRDKEKTSGSATNR
jgi:Fe-S cluster assembly iron-binding protein IscA